MRKSLDVLDRRLNMSLTTQVKVAKFSFLNEKSYNKTVIYFNFSRQKDLYALKSDIHLSLAASVNYHFFRVDKSLCLPHSGRPWPAAYINVSQNIHQNQVLTEPLYSA